MVAITFGYDAGIVILALDRCTIHQTPGTLRGRPVLATLSIRANNPVLFFDLFMQWSHLKHFDEVGHTDTGDMISLSGLNITSPNLRFGEQYQGINPTIFFEAVESVPLDRKEWTFVDLGCGKGRAVLLASFLSFKNIIGVEFSPVLAAIARENLIRFTASQQQECRISIIDADAADYLFPLDKILLFLFNPFTSPVIDRVIANLIHSCEHRAAEAFVVYVTPVCHELFIGTHAFEICAVAPKFSCYRFRGRFDR